MQEWNKERERNQILIMTPQIFLDILRHAFFLLEWVNLLIIDECHHAHKSHPYSLIFEEFYFPLDQEKRPKVFGMSAVPASDIRITDNDTEIKQKIEALERTLDSNACLFLHHLTDNSSIPRPQITSTYWKRYLVPRK